MDTRVTDEAKFYPKYVAPGIQFTDIANGSGLTLACVSRVMNGSRVGRPETLQRIASYLTGATGTMHTIDSLMRLIEKKPWLQ
jgi:hypothetical protein